MVGIIHKNKLKDFPHYKMTHFIKINRKNDPLSNFPFLIYLSFLINSFEKLLSTIHLSSLHVFTKEYLIIVEQTVLTKINPMSTQYQVYISDLPILDDSEVFLSFHSICITWWVPFKSFKQWYYKFAIQCFTRLMQWKKEEKRWIGFSKNISLLLISLIRLTSHKFW